MSTYFIFGLKLLPADWIGLLFSWETEFFASLLFDGCDHIHNALEVIQEQDEGSEMQINHFVDVIC